jgi:hypothetical protein
MGTKFGLMVEYSWSGSRFQHFRVIVSFLFGHDESFCLFFGETLIIIVCGLPLRAVVSELRGDSQGLHNYIALPIS